MQAMLARRAKERHEKQTRQDRHHITVRLFKKTTGPLHSMIRFNSKKREKHGTNIEIDNRTRQEGS